MYNGEKQIELGTVVVGTVKSSICGSCGTFFSSPAASMTFGAVSTFPCFRSGFILLKFYFQCQNLKSPPDFITELHVFTFFGAVNVSD